MSIEMVIAILVGLGILFLLSRIQSPGKHAATTKGQLAAERVGLYAETQVEKILEQVSREVGGAHLHDVLLSYGNGYYAQIDHLYFGPAGVYVIETKHRAGNIIGSAGQDVWKIQKRGKRTTTMQNPIKQNEPHVAAVSELLGLPKKYIHSVIIFVGNCSLPKLGAFAPPVIKIGGLKKLLVSNKTRRYSRMEWQRMVKNVDHANIKDAAFRAKRVDELKRRYEY